MVTLNESPQKKAIKNLKEMQQGDVENTFADTSKLEKWINFISNKNF